MLASPAPDVVAAGRPTAPDRLAPVVLLAAWLAVVIVTTLNHEYRRDEVRPWVLAGAAHSPLDLFHRIRYEGHPLL